MSTWLEIKYYISMIWRKGGDLWKSWGLKKVKEMLELGTYKVHNFLSLYTNILTNF